MAVPSKKRKQVSKRLAGQYETIIHTAATTQHNTNTNTNNNILENNIESLNGTNERTITDTVGFSDVGYVPHLEGNEESFLGQLRTTLPDTTDKSIAEILGRWDIRGSYDLHNTAGTQGIYEVSNNISNMWAYHKLDGFLGFTASFGMKLVWNTPPTYQGLYILAYVPPGVFVPKVTGGTAAAAANTVAEIMFLTGCQHVLFSLSESTSAELIVPYVGPNTFIPVAGRAQNQIPLLGHFVLRSISNVTSSTDTGAVHYTAYVCLKDLRTYGARQANANIADSPTYGQLFSQSGLIAGAEALQKSKVVSSVTGSISGFLQKAGKYIPDSIVPKEYIGAASWVSGGVSKIADMLGWSKPFAVNALTPVCPISYSDITVSDATFTGAKFAMNSDAGIGKMDLSGRGVDEMQISEVLSRPNLLPTETGEMFTSWLPTEPHGKIVRRFEVCPHDFRFEAGTVAYFNTQMSYVASMFTRWRGSIQVRLMPICTKFHSGRLRVVFVPTGTVDVDDANVAYSYTHIVDIRDSASWDFMIPYIAQTPWMNTKQSIGTVKIIVDTPLVASSGAKTSIDICLFVSGGPTLEFAIPSMTYLLNPGFVSPNWPDTRMESQSGLSTFTNERSIAVQMAPDMDSDSVFANSLAMGDPVRSLRALCKKFWISRKPTWTSTLNVGNLPIPLVPNAGRDLGDIDMISVVASLFCYWRGGMRIYAQNYLPCRVMSSPTFLDTDTLPSLTPTGQFNYTVDYSNVSTFAPTSVTEPVKVELPYNFESVCRNTFIIGTREEQVLSLNAVYYMGGNDLIIQRAMADDFDMGNLVGAPMVLL